MHISPEHIQEFKEIFKKEYGKELSDAEASEAAYQLVGFFDLLWKVSKREAQRKRRLKQEPQGFHVMDGTYNCMVCHRAVTGDQSWYDHGGVKCLLCQKAVKAGVIPYFVCKNRDSHYTIWALQSKFGIKSPTVRKLVRQGNLKARIVTHEDGKPYEYIFLKKENPDLVDPDRKSPARKSYDRNYNKIMDVRIKEEKKKNREEFEAIKKRLRTKR